MEIACSCRVGVFGAFTGVYTTLFLGMCWAATCALGALPGKRHQQIHTVEKD